MTALKWQQQWKKCMYDMKYTKKGMIGCCGNLESSSQLFCPDKYEEKPTVDTVINH